MSIHIERGIPIPPRGTNMVSTWKDLTGKWRVGDSVVLTRKQRMSLASYCRRIGQSIATRKIEADRVRVWRK